MTTQIKRISLTKPNDPLLLAQHGYGPAEDRAQWLREIADDIEGRREPNWWVAISITIKKRQVSVRKLETISLAKSEAGQ